MRGRSHADDDSRFQESSHLTLESKSLELPQAKKTAPPGKNLGFDSDSLER